MITAWCRLEKGEGGSFFLKPDIVREQVPKLSNGEKYSVQTTCGLFGTSLSVERILCM